MSIDDTLGLGRGIVDLWYCFHEGLDAGLLSAYEGLMTADERERHAHFRFERDRRLFAATRALVRTVLSAYAPVAPADWRFASGEHGKPRVAHPTPRPFLHFNLSNAAGIVACVVSTAHESVGVDVEALDRRPDVEAIAGSYFSVAEVHALLKVPPDERHRRFIDYWTLKESYIKARGLGLALPLDQFSFLLDEPAARIAFGPGLADDAARWRFALIEASPRHTIAVGVDTGGAPLLLRTTHFVPLRGIVPPPALACA